MIELTNAELFLWVWCVIATSIAVYLSSRVSYLSKGLVLILDKEEAYAKAKKLRQEYLNKAK